MANARQFMAARTAAKSGDYDLCDFICSDGNAHIDLGIKPLTKLGFSIEASGIYHGFSDAFALFGAVNGNTSSVFSNATCFFGSLFQDRLFAYNQGLGTAGYWESSAYGGRAWLDGNFHLIEIPYENSYADYRPSSLSYHYLDTIDGTAIRTNSSIGNLSGSLPSGNLAAFAMVSNTGEKFYQVSESLNIKIRKIALTDEHGTVADFRAASKNGEYGLINIVDGSFHGGIGGTISGS